MFTGIIETIGRVADIQRKGTDARLVVDAGALDTSDIKLGDSVAVSGVCLTVIAATGPSLSFDVSTETLSRTTLGARQRGDAVNLEKALLPTTRLGGHLVSGHIDGVGKVINREQAGESVRFRIEAPQALARYIAEKGSICVEGVSLTVNAIDECAFDVNIVPHTLAATTLGALRSGGHVNLEVDLLARYLERLMRGETTAQSGGITADFLADYGFTK